MRRPGTARLGFLHRHELAEPSVLVEIAEGLDADTLNRTATQAKEQCPISVLLKPGLESLTLDVKLK